MYSTIANYHYDIEVFVPNVEPPANGFPVLFVLDGQRYSDMIFNVLQNQIRMSAKTRVEPMIVVSIGHNVDDFSQRRFFDFTAPADRYVFPLRRGKQMEAVPVGNGLKFLHFIEDELMPYVVENYNVDAERFSLYGHSLGGLFSLWAALQEPKLFASYVAVSPSVWWNEHELLRLLETAKDTSRRVAIYVGGDEGDMVDDAKKFYNYYRNGDTEFYVALNENHASVIPTTISKALRFISK